MYRFTLTAVLLGFAMLGSLTAQASELPINVYRQTDPAWANDRMGNGGTIGQQGCMMTSLAMAFRVSPKDLNRWLNANGGYANGGLLNHQRAAAFDGPGGIQYVGPGNLPLSWDSIDRGIARGGVYITRSRRFSEHWVIVYKAGVGQAYYADPYDGTVRRVGDGWVNYGNEARIYSFAR